MTAEELFTKVIDKATEFGLVAKNDGRTIIEPKGNAVIRKNISESAFADGSAYFGILSGEEETAGPYSDFSFVIFPEQELGACVVGLVVGSQGFRNDYQLASLPGLRRMFLKLRSDDNLSFFKTSFDDIGSTSTGILAEVRANFEGLKDVIDSYKTVLPASRIVSFERFVSYKDEETGETIEDTRSENKIIKDALDTIYIWLATYAHMREWGTNAQKKVIKSYIEKIPTPEIPNEAEEIMDLLDSRKYVVLQGAPGTGKTFTSLKIAEEYDKTFFEQFHAETTYSDFVYGLEPNLEAEVGMSQFKPKEGVLYQSVKYALENPEENVLLIIDEINRANLSNVLGPVFYLFEYQSGKRTTEMEIGDISLSKLPDNLHVIATMNTADRSLAVVDFALRRRFAWYTLRPHEIQPGTGKKWMSVYNDFANIFYQYATDDELNLQPGQSYFIVDKGTGNTSAEKKQQEKEEMKERLIYELMPLIKEYLAEGYLLKAKDSFYELFLRETGKQMYE